MKSFPFSTTPSNTQPMYTLTCPTFVESPSQAQLGLKMGNCPQSLPLLFKAEGEHLRRGEDQSGEEGDQQGEEDRTGEEERMGEGDGSSRTVGAFSMGESRAVSIKSYLRIKPDKNVSFAPFEVYNGQRVIIDRWAYKFDRVLEANARQSEVYDVVAREVTLKFLEGFNATIFAYGSTGSGKTFTMFGDNDGIVPSVVEEVFTNLQPHSTLACSMLEIYKETLIDLFSPEQDPLELKIKELGPSSYVQGLTTHQVKTQSETLHLINRGNHLKRVRETHLNQSSSRSHIVFTLYLKRVDEQGRPVNAKFNLVDLAGSEKVGRSKVQGQGLEQAKKINLSLSCLGNTISALVRNSEHIPYRESKLTRILRESLMGNSLTRLIVTCSVHQEALEETVSSMKFAQRAQKVQTQAQVSYNINRFRGQKEEKLKHMRSALEIAQTKLNRVIEKVSDQSNCQICREVAEVLDKKQSTDEIFRFNSLSTFHSPKAQINLRTVPSNSKFSSVPRDSQKRSLQKRIPQENNQRKWDNKRIYDLEIENKKLIDQNKELSQRIEALKDKHKDVQHLKEKHQDVQSLNCNNPTRKVIKLSSNIENGANKENISDLMNKAKKKSKRMQGPAEKVEQTGQRSQILVKELIQKLEEATDNYKQALKPLQVQVLSEEIKLLEEKIKIRKDNPIFSAWRKLYCQFKTQFSRLFEEITLIVERIIKDSDSEQQFWSGIWKEKEGEAEELLMSSQKESGWLERSLNSENQFLTQPFLT